MLDRHRKIDFFLNERLLCYSAVIFLIFLSFAGYFLADYYVTDNFAYDWYDPKASFAYRYVNFTYIRCFENAILIACIYLHR